MAAETIKVTELTRNTSAGRYTYAMYRARTARRPAKVGRPHYELIPGITVGPGDRVHGREVNVNSQLGRVMLG